MTVAEILPRLPKPVSRTRTGWRARCPVHNGQSSTSLSITEGDGERVLVHCFGAGCSYPEILAALGVERPGAKGAHAHLSPREEATRALLRQRWNDRKVLDAYAEADAFRHVSQQIQRIRRDARTDSPTTWARLAHAARLEDEVRRLEAEMDGVRA